MLDPPRIEGGPGGVEFLDAGSGPCVEADVGPLAALHVDHPRVARRALQVRFQAHRQPLLELEEVDAFLPLVADRRELLQEDRGRWASRRICVGGVG